MKTARDTTVYTPASPLSAPGRMAGAMWRDLRLASHLAWRLLVRNLSAQYRQTALGYIWAFVPPLITSLLWIFLNAQKIVSFGSTEIPYPVYVLIGTLLWQVFVDAINSPLRIMNQSTQMLAKINFPREALILAAAGEVVFNFLIRLVLLAAVFVLFRVPLQSGLLLAPLGIAALILLGLVCGILLTPLGMLYQDVQRGVLVLTQPWFYLTPVIYPLPDSGLMSLVAGLNPVRPLLVMTRELLTTGHLVQVPGALLVGCLSLFLLAAGWILYRIAMPHLVERMSA